MDWKKLLKKIPRRQYLRPNPPSKKEKTIGYLILTIVVMIGIAIVVSGRYYDQNLFRLNPKLLNETGGEKVVRVAGGERRGSRDGEPVGINNSESSKPSSNSNLFPETIPGWSRKGDVQRFTTDNLYDKVDGRENLYKSYEFKELLAADFYADGTANRFIQIELFDMTSPRSALGVFTAERPSSPTSANIGRESYVDTNGAFFWKGKYYVRV
ncbi:MAG: hypothetical protein JNN15_15725, partial [Blastocatellia bacterium]|nr:hypothetical protein [Blastocatellia bacterium]